MIFQHTIGNVLSGKKTQTSRVWKPWYKIEFDDIGRDIITSSRSDRRLLYPGQCHAVQPGRGMKGLARIEIMSLSIQTVADYDSDDIRREGFASYEAFIALWHLMHPETYSAVRIIFKCTNLTI